MNLNSKKLTIPDLIFVGVFTAIYFVLVTIATFSCALLPGVGNILLPAVAALISGSVYMLLAAKLQKFGGISIMGLVMGLFFFVSGHFVLSFAANIVCGVLADWVASRSQYRSKKVLLASYVIFSYGLTGPILPLWFMKDAYIANLTARGKDAAAEHQGDHDDLQHVCVGEGLPHVAREDGDQGIHEVGAGGLIPDRAILQRERGEPACIVEEVGEYQADDAGRGRGDKEVGDRLPADGADLLHIAHGDDAVDHRQQHDGDDDELEEVDEDGAEGL